MTETDFCAMFDFGGDAAMNCKPNVDDISKQYPELTLASALLERAELTEIFTCPGPFTLLLPSNSAFDNVDPVFLEFLLRPENQEALEDVMLYHILPGLFPTSELISGELETLLPGETVTMTSPPVMFNDAAVSNADIEACNGLVNIIDTVLLPFAPRKSSSIPSRMEERFGSLSLDTDPFAIVVLFSNYSTRYHPSSS